MAASITDPILTAQEWDELCGSTPLGGAVNALNGGSYLPFMQPNLPRDAFAEPRTLSSPWHATTAPLPTSPHNTATVGFWPVMTPSLNHPSSRSLLEAPSGSLASTDGLAGNGTHDTSLSDILRVLPTERAHGNTSQRRHRGGRRAGGSSRRHPGRTPVQSPPAKQGGLDIASLDRGLSKENSDSSSAKSPSSSLQERLSNATKVCCIWIETHPGLEPSPGDVECLSTIAHVSPEWIHEQIKSTLREQIKNLSRDSGYQTRPIGDSEITKKYEYRQPVRAKGRDGRPRTNLKNAERPFVCTHRCGMDFDKKAAWEKHEQIHYPQHVWVCPENCQGQQRVWLRKDHFRKHLVKHHEYDKVTEQHCRASYLPVASRYPRRCHISECDQNFNSWDDRMSHMTAHMKEDYDMSTWSALVDEVENHGIEGPPEKAGDDDSESSDQDSGKDDDSDDPDEDQGGPGNGGSGFASGSGNGQGSNGQGLWGQPPNPGPQRQSETDYDGSSRSYNQWYGYTGNQMHMLTGLASTKRTFHIRGSMQSTSHEIRKPDTTDLERDCEGITALKPHWTLSDFRLSSVRWLGSGATARVDEVKTPGAKETMARKVIQYRYPAARQRVDREEYIMHRLQHSHIVRLLTTLRDTSTATLFMKPAADYSLAYYIQTRCSASPAGRETWKWFSCLVSGLHYMHKQGILHGDIKPDNILVFNHHIFYTDFGLSNTIPDDKSMISDAGFITRQYAAPEVKRGKRGKPSDIWSLGCVFLELVTIMLHRPITDFYEGRKLQKTKQSGDTVDSSYSNNLIAVAEWIKALRQVSYVDQAPMAVITGLESCQKMMSPEPKQRLTALQLSSRMPPQACCVAFEHTSPRRDKSLDSRSLVNRDPMSYIVRSRGSQASDDGSSRKVSTNIISLPRSERIPWPQLVGAVTHRHTTSPDGSSPMSWSSTLSYWLSEPNSYEALVTGCMDMFKTHPRVFIRELLDTLNTQIDSSSVTGPSLENQLIESHEIADSPDLIRTANQGDLITQVYQCHSEKSLRDASSMTKSTQPELHVYSRAKHIWLNVTCTLDTETRQDCVSEKLVDKLGVQSETSFHCVEEPEFRRDKNRQCRTVQLPWHESKSLQTRENWFVVVEGSFDIVIGSDFLLTHAISTYRKSAIWSSDWWKTQETNTQNKHESWDQDNGKKLSIRGRAVGLRKLTSRAKSHLKHMRNRNSMDQRLFPDPGGAHIEVAQVFQQVSSGRYHARGNNQKIEHPPSTTTPPFAYPTADIGDDRVSEICIVSGIDAGNLSDVREDHDPAPATENLRGNTDKAEKEESQNQTRRNTAVGKSVSPVNHAITPIGHEAPRVTKRSRVYQTLRGTQADRSIDNSHPKKSRFQLTGRGIPADSKPQCWLDGWDDIEAYPQSQYGQSLQATYGQGGINRLSYTNGQSEQEHAPAEPRQPLSWCRFRARESLGCQRWPNCQVSCKLQGFR
ncbi:hypothetical protein MMC30_002216 [Trapelia coarctata]|nr:hypothetical protein [Trapelia coarctata]